MTTETTTSMQEKTLAKLRDLIRINQDSARGFEEAAKAVDNGQLQRLFNDLAAQRGRFAAELKGYVEMNGQDADDEAEGSWVGQFHRWWLDLRATLTGGGAYAVLAEAERGEDQIKAMYEEVITKTTGNAVNDVLHQQYVQVKKGHDTVRDLRDAVKQAKQ